MARKVSGYIARVGRRWLCRPGHRTTAERFSPMSDISLLAEIIDPPPMSTPVSRDRDDDFVLAVAMAGRVDLIISGDLDLLVLEKYLDIDIVTPAQAVSRLIAGV